MTLEAAPGPKQLIAHRGASGYAPSTRAFDFTLAEIKRLDAGRWFDARFAAERVLTFEEAIDTLKGKVGLYPDSIA